MQITGSVYTDALSDRTRFPSFFRVFPNSEGLAFGILTVIKLFNWTRVLFLTQQESLFIKVCAMLPYGLLDVIGMITFFIHTLCIQKSIMQQLELFLFKHFVAFESCILQVY